MMYLRSHREIGLRMKSMLCNSKTCARIHVRINLMIKAIWKDHTIQRENPVGRGRGLRKLHKRL